MQASRYKPGMARLSQATRTNPQATLLPAQVRLPLVVALPVPFRRLLADGDFAEAAARAVRVEQRSRHAMLFSFEKMALRDALREPSGARDFAHGLYEFLHGRGGMQGRFERWVEVIAGLQGSDEY